jgi:beta-aspartyl-peptidase (threonine type)
MKHFPKLLTNIALSLALAAASTSIYANHHKGDEHKKSDDKQKVSIAIHGGAGTISKANLTSEQEAEFRKTLKEALMIGHASLVANEDGAIAVIKTIQHLENSPLFNAGVGAVYTYDGTHELDASIMHGKDKNAGAVAGVKTIKSPIAAANLVMNESVHVMLSGEGAESFAFKHGLEKALNTSFDTPHRLEALNKAKIKIKENEQAFYQHPENADYKFGTVGAVVLDAKGNLIAGTSTGGMTAKRYGRVGDSPIIGAGTFADNESCAVSGTGHGEFFIRFNVASDICARMKYQGVSLDQAANDVVNKVLKDAGGTGGVIAVDKDGNISMPFNTEGMYRGSVDTDGNIYIGIYGDE